VLLTALIRFDVLEGIPIELDLGSLAAHVAIHASCR
jgi:hypothetical protein